MSDLDNKIITFIDSMNKAAQYAKGDDSTDVITPSGAIPSVAKQAKQNREALQALLPDLNNRVRMDIVVPDVTELQKSNARTNIGLEQVDNTPDASKPVSAAQELVFQSLTNQISQKENSTNRNVQDGYVGLSGWSIPLRNLADSFTSYFSTAVTAARSWIMPDKSGTVALLSDITGTNSGTNTGDETTATIKAKLNVTSLSGSNTGDETAASIISALNYTPINPSTKNASGGVVGLTAFKTNFMNLAGDVMSWFSNSATAPRTYLFPDKDGTVAMMDDLTGTSTGTNTGDQTITLNGDVAGSGTGTFSTAVQPKVITFAKMADVGTGIFLGRATIGSGSVEELLPATAKALIALDNVDNTPDASKPVSSIQGAAIALKEDLINKAIDFSTVNNTLYPTVAAVKNQINAVAVGNVNDRGTWDASGVTFPITGGSGASGAIVRGNLWTVTVAGTLGALAVKPGESLRALIDNPGQTPANWNISQGALGINVVNKAGDILTGALDFAVGTSVVSAATLDLSSVIGNIVDISGSNTITSITLAPGAVRWVRFLGSLTLTNSSSIVLPGETNLVTTSGDQACFVGRAGGVVHCVAYATITGESVISTPPGQDKTRSITANTATTLIDLNNGDKATAFKVTVAANTTITFTNPPPAPAGEIFSFTLILINDATPGRAVAYGNAIRWAGGLLPPRTTSANAIDTWFFYIDGTTYTGSLSIEDSK